MNQTSETEMYQFPFSKMEAGTPDKGVARFIGAVVASSMPFDRHGAEACPEQVRAPVMYQEGCSGAVEREDTADDLSREVYCLLGLPIDAIGIPSVVRRIELAAAGSSPFMLST